MSLLRFKGANHPQQVAQRGSREDVDDRAADPAWFAALDRRFRFTLDVAASAHNTKCVRFFDKHTDGLAQPWAAERVWCNPPYSNIGPWVAKAWKEAAAELVVMVLPANRTEQAWWQELVEPYRDGGMAALITEFLPGRLRFIRADRDHIGPNERPPFGCVLLVWSGAARSGARPTDLLLRAWGTHQQQLAIPEPRPS